MSLKDYAEREIEDFVERSKARGEASGKSADRQARIAKEILTDDCPACAIIETLQAISLTCVGLNGGCQTDGMEEMLTEHTVSPRLAASLGTRCWFLDLSRLMETDLPIHTCRGKQRRDNT